MPVLLVLVMLETVALMGTTPSSDVGALELVTLNV